MVVAQAVGEHAQFLGQVQHMVVEATHIEHITETESIFVFVRGTVEQFTRTAHRQKHELDPCDLEEDIVVDGAITTGKTFAMRSVHGEVAKCKRMFFARRDFVLADNLFAQRLVRDVAIPRSVISVGEAQTEPGNGRFPRTD